MASSPDPIPDPIPSIRSTYTVLDDQAQSVSMDATAAFGAEALGARTGPIVSRVLHSVICSVHVDGIQRWYGRTPTVLIGSDPESFGLAARSDFASALDAADLTAALDAADLAAALDAPDQPPTSIGGSMRANGEIWVAVMAPRRPDRWVAMWWQSVRGAALCAEDLRWFRGHWVQMRAHRARAYDLDGEPRPPTRLLDVRSAD